jgi:SCP-2 sterol transfer family
MASEKPEFGTLGYFEALAAEMNSDQKWLEMAKSITFTWAYRYEPPIDRVFFMRFEGGRIVEVCELGSLDERPTDFTFSAKPEHWAAVISRTLNPTTAMATGKIKVTGSQTSLIRNMRKLSYLNEKMSGMDALMPQSSPA